MDATFVSDQMQRQRRERHSTTEYSAIFVAWKKCLKMMWLKAHLNWNKHHMKWHNSLKVT
jgi:hypothetical protein